MEYTWNESKIRRLASLAKKDEDIELYSALLSLIDIKSEDFDKKDILLLDPDDELDFLSRMKIYITGLDYIPDQLFNDITDMFYWIPDFHSISVNTKFNKLDLSDKDLIDLVYEMIESINNKELLKAYKDLINRDNHLLMIQKESDEIKTVTEKLGGITFKNPRSKKSYVSIFRNGTIEDAEILLHETMHYLYNYLLFKRNKIKDVKMLTELEGQFGSQYAARYLSKYYKEEAKKLRRECFNSTLTSAFLCLVNTCLYQTAKNQEFQLDAAEELINRDLTNGKIRILPEEVEMYTTVKGFETMTNIISYLIALELLNEETPNESLNYIYNLKFDDGKNLLELFDQYGIHFHTDGYKDFIKEYKLTHK